jgi:hypothetical protein
MDVNPEDLFARNYNELSSFRSTNDVLKSIKLAAILRQLILDSSPLLHVVNRKHRIKIKFSVDSTFRRYFKTDAFIKYTSTEIGDLKLVFSKNLKELDIANFLSLDILEIEGTNFTVREIIKFAANKAGGVHFDTNLDVRENELLTSLRKINAHSNEVISVLINAITDITLLALKDLKEKVLTLPDYSIFLAHYNQPEGRALFFNGNSVMQTENLNVVIEDGFGWFSEVKIIPQETKHRHYLYELVGAEKEGINFKIFIELNSDIGAEISLNGEDKLSVRVPSFTSHSQFNTYFSLSIILSLQSNEATFEIWTNKNLIDKSKIKFSSINKELFKQVIGANIEGKQTSKFYIKELIMLRSGLTDTNRNAVLNYLERKGRV